MNRPAPGMAGIASRLVAARKKAGLTQAGLATLLQIETADIRQWEGGKSLPATTRLPGLASALAMTADWLLTGAETPAAGPQAHTEATTDTSGLTLLGRLAGVPESPEQAVLERVPNPHPGQRYCVRFTAPEFTSLCPLTGQPDFAHLVIDYVPDAWLVESKALKLYLSAFRNHGAFHEACTVAIALRLVETIAPAWLRIGGYWYPRGGIPIDIFWQSGEAPSGVWIPDQGVPPYRGRG